MGSLFEHNIGFLASVNREGYKLVNESEGTDLLIKPITTTNGDLTFEIIRGGRRLFLHSKFDPLKEARIFAGQVNKGDTVVLYGFGLGYHVREILNRIGQKGRVYVIETNLAVFREVLKHVDLRNLFMDKRLSLVLEEHLSAAAKGLAALIQIVSQKDGQLLIHRPSLDLVPEEAAYLRELLLEWRAKEDSTKRFAGLLEENIKNNLELIRELPCVSKIFNKFSGQPLLLVATGPSLDANLSHIKRYRDKVKILAVGSALAPLEKAGIEPDLAIITDPQEKVFQQIDGLRVKPPLVLLPSVNPKIFGDYSGTKLIAYQKGIDLVEQLALERDEELVNTGGSVVTTALDIAIRMGCNPIMFIGLDLAYSSNKTHAGGTMYKAIHTARTAELITVNNYQGENILAPPNLVAYRKWIERRVSKEDKLIQFINLSPEGALIEGVPYKNWQEVLEG